MRTVQKLGFWGTSLHILPVENVRFVVYLRIREFMYKIICTSIFGKKCDDIITQFLLLAASCRNRNENLFVIEEFIK